MISPQLLKEQESKDFQDTSDPHRRNSAARVLLLGISVFALGQALEFGNGFNNLPGYIGLTLCLYFLLASVIIPKKSPFPLIPQKLVFTILLLEVVCQIIELLIAIPSFPMPTELIANLWQFRLLISLGGTCALLSLCLPQSFRVWVKRVVIGLTFLFFFAAGVWIIQGTPNPGIDVYLFQQYSSRAISQLQNPYETTIPNIYQDTSLYGDGVVKNGMLTIGNPYPPLSVYFSFIGYAIAGDVRYSYLLAIIISGVILLSFNPDRIGLLITYLFLFTPRIFYVLEESWTEPFVVLAVLVVIWSAIYKPSWVFITLGFLLASKQYLLFLMPLFVFLFPVNSHPKTKIRASFVTISVASLITAPLAVWNLNAFMWNVGLVQWYQPFRFDALSYAPLIADAFGQKYTPYLPFIALFAAILISYRYFTPSPKSFALSMAFGFALFFAFNKQAFCNYYFLVIGLLCSAIAVSQRAFNLDESTKISSPNSNWKIVESPGLPK